MSREGGAELYDRLRPLLFRLDPERAHALALGLLRWAGGLPATNAMLRRSFCVADPRLEVGVFGLRFPNPVGLAAGFDKDGRALRGLASLGFGHIEIGTVTLRPQPGNPRPRLWRVPEANALVNSMGFPNAGVDALELRGRLTARMGVSLGMGRDTPFERAGEDYVELLRRVHGRVDYVALNVSSPNTPGLRRLQVRGAVESLLRAVMGARDALMPRLPVLLKIAPDLTWGEIDDLLAAGLSSGLDGIIATNTTLGREGAPAYAAGLAGGLSGPPLRERATAIVGYVARQTRGRLPIIGAGGVAGAADALEKLLAGASLVQVYTGLVYAGPGLARTINLGLLRACEAAGVSRVAELAGVAAKPPA